MPGLVSGCRRGDVLSAVSSMSDAAITGNPTCQKLHGRLDHGQKLGIVAKTRQAFLALVRGADSECMDLQNLLSDESAFLSLGIEGTALEKKAVAAGVVAIGFAVSKALES